MTKTVRPRLSQEAYEALERVSRGYHDRDSAIIAIEYRLKKAQSDLIKHTKDLNQYRETNKEMETNIAWLKHQMYLARSESIGLSKQLLALKGMRGYLSICGWTLAATGWFAAAVFAFM